jgi:chemotaxis protein MotB
LLEEQEGGGGHESSERWLVSYADFITLLFALFVLLYALSNSNHVDQTRAMDSVKRAVGIHPERGGMRPDLGDSGHATIDEIEHLEAVQEQMTIALQNYPNSGITMKIDDRGLVISLAAAKFFASGEAQIAPSQLLVLDAVIKTIAPLANLFEIDGFTDSVPIQSGQFRDNWELSSARAAEVLRYALAHSTLNPNRFEIAGYGPYRTVADNSTEEGRALNRRVEIVVKPMGAKSS